MFTPSLACKPANSSPCAPRIHPPPCRAHLHSQALHMKHTPAHPLGAHACTPCQHTQVYPRDSPYTTHIKCTLVYVPISHQHTPTYRVPFPCTPAATARTTQTLELLCPQGKLGLQAAPFPWIHPQILHKPCRRHPVMLLTLHSLLDYPKGLSSPSILPPISPHQS